MIQANLETDDYVKFEKLCIERLSELDKEKLLKQRKKDTQSEIDTD